MSELTFEAWPKIPRWSNETVTITEKIDGTNGCIVILPFSADHTEMGNDGYAMYIASNEDNVEPSFTFAVQSRKRFIKPGKDTDNAGFAAWAFDNAVDLVDTLGYGKHYGEWWGRGIQRGYNLPGKKFSLFRPWRYEDVLPGVMDGLDTVPVLFSGSAVGLLTVDMVLATLEKEGSKAAPGYMRPEGVIIQTALTQSTYKAFTWDDGVPKSFKEGN